jgi:opacity protein-like surface antigen
MKRLRALVAGVSLLAAPASLLAQEGGSRSPLSRADVSGTVGWVHVNKSEFTDYNDWRSQAGFGLSAGWYWTDHHVTRVSATGTTTATLYAPVTIVVNNLPVFVSTRRSFSTRRLGIVQQYQFGRNEWVHPYVGVGADVVRRSSSLDRPTQSRTVFLQNRSVPVDIPAATERKTMVFAQAVLKTGLKMYIGEKTFFNTELKFGVRRDVDHLVWKMGMGFDF